jgi:hypothetical protein
MKRKDLEIIKKEIFYAYFIEYLLFSNNFDNLIENGYLDIDIKSGLVTYLYEFILNIKDNNIYPKYIIDRLKQLIKKLENYELCKDYEELIKPMSEIMNENDFSDSTEVYNREYISRYANVNNSKNYDLLPVTKLYIDIQKDFQYFNALCMKNKELEQCIDEDFLYFLNKLMIDFPEIYMYKPMKDKIIRILKEKKYENGDKYIHIFSDKTRYKRYVGFDLSKVEGFYLLTILKKLLFSKNISQELNEVPLYYLYNDNFLQNMCFQVEEYVENGGVIKQIYDNFIELLDYLRIHLNDLDLSYKKDIIAIINSCMTNLNMLKKETSTYIYLNEQCIRLGSGLEFLLSDNLKKEEMINHIDFLISLTPIVFEYLLGKRELKEIKDKCQEEEFISVIQYLFNNYPKMFFDDTIYERTMSLLNNINVNTNDIKKKIYKIRG